MRFARSTPNATDTHSEYVILIAFALQQWLHDLASLLRYMYTACIVVTETVYCAARTGYSHVTFSP